MKNLTRETLRVYWDYSLKHKWLLFLVLTGVVGGSFLETIKPFLYKQFFDNFSSPNPDPGFLVKIILMATGLTLASWAFWRAGTYATTYHQTKVMEQLTVKCFAYMQKHSYRFFTNNFAGSLVRKVNKFARSYEIISDQITWSLIPITVRVIAVAAIVFYRFKILGLMIIAWSFFYLYFNYAFSKYKLKYDVIRTQKDTEITGFLADAITNNTNVKLFASENMEAKNFSKKTFDWLKANIESWNLTNLGEALQSLLMIGLEAAIFLLALKLWKLGKLTVGDFVMLQSYLLILFNRLWDFGRNIRRIYESLADAEEMTAILSEPYEIKDKISAKQLVASHGKIEFSNVIFTYGSAQTEIFKNFSLKIKAGEKVALVGPSGGGKSTVTKLLLRLYDITGGEILIDGQNIAKVTQNSLRESIALVPQDPILFHRTLLENIRYGKPDASDEEARAAAKMAHCHEFIERFPKKYMTYVGERGIRLSGGERQRVAIARAILKNSPILILDEATSSLDSESEMLIQDALKNLMRGKTTIVIAHRLSTIMQMDRILVLENGQITEEGRHRELLKIKQGTYQKLWEIQAGGFV